MTRENEQLSILSEEEGSKDKPVTVLGMKFKNDKDRRDYFTEELRKELTELKKIEGFPLGDDEDILALSDPPYYTACPNPWINDFVSDWLDSGDNNKNYLKVARSKEPFVANVAEGKYDKSYKFHPYSTKVPHKAIMRYILHYTLPGDIVVDSFSGTGMTGVASQYCNSPNEIKELGYEVDNDGYVYYPVNHDNNSIGATPFSQVGERKVIQNDLSVAASYISYNFNSYDEKSELTKLKNYIQDVRLKTSWMFKTLHDPTEEQILIGTDLLNNIESIDDGTQALISSQLKCGDINFVSWSDVFVCSECSNEVVYWDAAVDEKSGKISNEFMCNKCNAKIKKSSAERAWETTFDHYLNKVVTFAKQMPVSINYTYGKSRYIKKPDEFDIKLLNVIKNLQIHSWVPDYEIPEGEKTTEPKRIGIDYVHQFYTSRNLYVLSLLNKKDSPRLIGKILTRVAARINKMYGLTYQSGRWGAGGGPLSGTLYIPSLVKELNMLVQLEKSLKTQKNKNWTLSKNVLQTNSSSTDLTIIPDSSVDYVFLDPPFGGNLMYSELNFVWESWLKVKTNIIQEAIVSKKHQKDLDYYKLLMVKCFKEAFRILKPGKWMTVEFSNTKAGVWNVIQSAITEAGFVIANVSSLDKKKGSFKAITTTTAVKQDLIITSYKPDSENIGKMKEEENTEDSAWTFVQQHLERLPVFIGQKGQGSIVTERTPRILFDRMVAYHVQNGLSVPISSSDFQATLIQRFPTRDGMVFLDNQVVEYDKKRILVKEFTQTTLFVSDENSAIEWIRQQLLRKPLTRQDLHPNFMKEIQHIDKHELLPELDDLLEQNFIKYDGSGNVPDQIVSYLRKNYKDLRGLGNDNRSIKAKAMNRWYVPNVNKQSDLEKLREKSLIREFETYVNEIENSRKKLKQFRTEAIRAGFKQAWGNKDYQKIVDVGKKLPEKVIQEDDKLLMYFDNAQIRLGM